MTTLPEHHAVPRWSWPEIEAALLAIPRHRWSSNQRCGLSEGDGETMMREAIARDLKRELGPCERCGK